MRRKWILVFTILAPAAAWADVAAVVPATSEDLQAFDQAVERQEHQGALGGEKSLGQTISSEAKKLHEDIQKPRGASRGNRDLRRDHEGAPDSREIRETISGKRTGREDNPGRGDSGKSVECGGDSSGGGH